MFKAVKVVNKYKKKRKKKNERPKKRRDGKSEKRLKKKLKSYRRVKKQLTGLNYILVGRLLLNSMTLWIGYRNIHKVAISGCEKD